MNYSLLHFLRKLERKINFDSIVQYKPYFPYVCNFFITGPTMIC